MMPIVSVIVTTYNRARVLGLCLEALARQTVRDFEVVITDDGSSDDTIGIVDSYSDRFPELKYVWQQDRGFRLCAARNNGIAISRGEAMVFIDCDILLGPSAIAAYTKLYKENPDRAIGGYYRYLPPMLIAVNDVRNHWGRIYSGMLPRLNHPHWNPAAFELKDAREAHGQFFLFEDEEKLWPQPFSLLGGNLMIPLHILDEVGWWDEGFVEHGGEDAEMSLRIAERYPFSYSITAGGCHIAHPRQVVTQDGYRVMDKIKAKHPQWFVEGEPIWTTDQWQNFRGRVNV